MKVQYRAWYNGLHNNLWQSIRQNSISELDGNCVILIMQGWFYFRTGDRWFANFWKGKANGEGRFYTKSGDAFFGNFKDGWRHGQFLCINANGTRLVVLLVSLSQLKLGQSYQLYCQHMLFNFIDMLIMFPPKTTYMPTI